MNSVKFYAQITLTLLLLLGVSVGFSFLHLGLLSTAIALAIALIKALLILLFFMHISRASPIVLLYMLAGFFWLGIMLVLTGTDYVSRLWR